MRRAVAVAAVPVAAVAAYHLTPPLARLDDAYIALHSARVLLAGHDPIFNVPALVGVTSPAYVALVAAILAAGVKVGDTALRAANALGIVAYGVAVWRLADTVGLSRSRRAALVAMALGSGIVIVFNLTNGLETGWAMAALTFAIGNARAGRAMGVAFWTGLLPFLRPDLAPASAIVLAYAIRGRRRTEQLAMVALAAAVAAPWLVWTRIDTGAWVTETMRAKQLFYAEACRAPAEKAVTVLRATGAALVQLFPLSLGVVALGRDRLGRAGVLAMAVSLVAYFVAFPGALAHPFFRYLCAILVPWLCLGLALALSRVPAVAAASGAIAMVAAFFVIPHDQNAEYSQDIKTTAEWMDAAAPPQAILLVHDAGGISEFAHHPAVDLVGLKTPSSIEAHARWTWPSCVAARGRAVGAIARDSGATYFVGVTGWKEYLKADLEAEGFRLTPIREPPTGSKGGYTVYRLQR